MGDEENNLGAFGTIAPLPGNEKPVSPSPQSSIFSIEYYSFLFNVSTQDVISRIVRSIIPYPPAFFSLIKKNPDLYGPFWISSSLIFVLAVTGNVGIYLSSEIQVPPDVGKLSFAASTIYGYLSFVSFLVYCVFRYFSSKQLSISLMEIVCIYGYSLFIYIPVAILCVIPSNGFRWTLTIISAVISSASVGLNCANEVKQDMKQMLFVVFIQCVVHFGFGVICQLYFFSY